MVSLDFSCGVFCASCLSCHHHASCLSCHHHASCLCDHDRHHSKLQLRLMLHLLLLLLLPPSPLAAAAAAELPAAAAAAAAADTGADSTLGAKKTAITATATAANIVLFISTLFYANAYTYFRDVCTITITRNNEPYYNYRLSIGQPSIASAILIHCNISINTL